jgi:hypothetical protein
VEKRPFPSRKFHQRSQKKREAPVKVGIIVPEVVGLLKDIQNQPEKLVESIRVDIRDSVGQYLSEMMKTDLSHILGRVDYKRVGEISVTAMAPMNVVLR